MNRVMKAPGNTDAIAWMLAQKPGNASKQSLSKEEAPGFSRLNAPAASLCMVP